MSKAPSKAPLAPGNVLVRVGADTIPCPKGATTPIYPVVELIWPASESDSGAFPTGKVRVGWSRREGDRRPIKNLSQAKVIHIHDPDDPDARCSSMQVAENPDDPDGLWGVRYKVSPRDRDQFEDLRRQWRGMWFLRISRQGIEESRWFCYFDDGTPFLGHFAARVRDTYVLDTAKSMRLALMAQWTEQAASIPESRYSKKVREEHAEVIRTIPEILEKIGGGPLPWIPKKLPHWGRPDRGAHDEIVKNYLVLLEMFKQSAEDKRNSEGRRKEFGYIWHLMRRAKIFEIAPESFVELHLEVDRYCTEEIAQLKFYDPRETDERPSDEEGKLLYKRQTAALESLPFPQKMPFDVCWFAISEGVGLSEHQRQTRGIKKGNAKHLLLGMLVTSSGEFHEVIITQDRRGAQGLLMVTHRVSPEMSQPWMAELRTEKAPTDRWYYPLCLAPFILHKIVDCINEHQTLIVSQRRLSTQNANRLKKGMKTPKNKKPVPPPFYTVYLKDKTIRETVRAYGVGVPRAAYSHRFDVRGHWCSRIHRGQLPMDPAEELKLESLKYEIYKNRPLDPWVKEIMREKNLPPRQHNQWIAIKRWWKGSYVKGPEDAEYIPSTRRATKGPLAFDNKPRRSENDSEATSLRGSVG